MWDALEHITQKFDTPISRSDHSTWIEFHKLLPKHSMLLQNWQIGHAQYVWDVRQNPKIVDIWKQLWFSATDSDKKLLVSYDGVSCHLPPETTGRGWLKTAGGWLHTDQSYARPDFECIQSWVTANDVLAGDATLMVLESSHKYHAEFAETYSDAASESKNDWYMVGERIGFYKDRGCKPALIKCPAGSMVFWDSRTIHCGQEPMKIRKKQNVRCVVYLCYTPRSLANESTLAKKRLYLENRRMTSHWPHKIRVFPVKPRLYPGQTLPDVTDIPAPVLTNLGKSLAGY
jgi:hypothetical protein